MKTRFPCTIMRGGTSKGIFLLEKDLPEDAALRDRIILAIFGSPDIRQIDGLGGADSLTSKLAVIAPAKESVVFGGSPISAKNEVVIGHPSGVMDLKVDVTSGKGGPHIVSCTVGRTARKIMDGSVYISEKIYSS